MSGSSSPAGAGRVLVDVDNRQQAHEVNIDHLTALLAATIGAQRRATQDPAPAEVGLAFIDVDEMSQLNSQHMGGSGPTDVLAFPIDGLDAAPVPDGQPVMFGDIVVCPAVAERAPQPLGDELALLVVHGALHLVGHDHREPDETAVMKALETDMLKQFHQP